MTIAAIAPGLKPLRVCFFVWSIFGVEGNELGFEGTVSEAAAAGGVFVKEQAGRGVDPQSPSLPEKAMTVNFVTRVWGKGP